MLAATALGLALRVLQLSRPGLLDGVTEYDDGVYFGAAVRLLQGWSPYRDFAFVQPPGVVVLMVPLAALARVTSTATGLAAARIATTAATVVTIPLVGRLLRREGTLALLLGCGVLAVSSAGMNAAHTLLLEPWSVLLVVLALVAVFEDGAPTPREGRVLAAGVLLGLAIAVKLWAVVPALVVAAACRLRLPRRAAGRLLLGAVLALALTVLPFAVLAPHAFVRDVVIAQLERTDVVRVPLLARLVNLTGLGAFAPGPPGVAPGAVWAVCGVAGAVILGAPALTARLTRRPPTALHACVVATVLILLVAFLVPADYFPHYGWFFAPFLALALGFGVGRTAWEGTARSRAPAVVLSVGVIVAVAVTARVEWRQLSQILGYQPAAVADREIPAGACVITDLVSLTVVADRFVSDRPQCSPMIDGLGTDLSLSRGRIGTTGAGRTPAVAAAWLDAFRHADYVWLQCPPAAPGCRTNRRVAWTPALRAYFSRHFRHAHGHLAGLWVRRESRPPRA